MAVLKPATHRSLDACTLCSPASTQFRMQASRLCRAGSTSYAPRLCCRSVGGQLLVLKRTGYVPRAKWACLRTASGLACWQEPSMSKGTF